jgi:ribonuclease BN (tRNA processing enzyme)
VESPPRELAERIVARGGRALLVGGDGRARQSLAEELLSELGRRSVSALVASSDVSLPLLGPPGAVSLGALSSGRLHSIRIEAVCTLDAARFRLPLVVALERLLDAVEADVLLLEVPRVTRGMAGAELAHGLLRAVSAGVVLHLRDAHEREGSLERELSASGADVVRIESEALHPPASSEDDRVRRRTRLWDEFLGEAVETSLPGRPVMPTLGAPPPLDASDAWRGRQVAVLGASGRTVAFGEILDVSPEVVRVRARRLVAEEPVALLVRDARRDGAGSLMTARPRPRLPEAETEQEHGADLRAAGRGRQGLFPPVMTLATAKAFLVNGIFGDPLLHVRLRHRKRSLLFDLGDAGRLAARIAHQVTDVFVSHAHFDHFGGFLWLLRSSIGSPRPRRIYGPPGIAAHVEGMIAGIRWDRIGDRGPVFDVFEVHAESRTMRRLRLRAGGNGAEPLAEVEMNDDVVLEEPEFRVRSRTLDHGIPVLAFALEETRALRVRPDKLRASGIPSGPWLSELKRRLLEEREDGPSSVTLPDGSVRSARELADELIVSRPGEKLVYATDFDDSDSNRERLTSLAAGARILFCEASFVEEDAALARSTHHLTARSCGTIAALAGVAKLVPFHFSKRYEDDPSRVYREVKGAFSRTVVAC